MDTSKIGGTEEKIMGLLNKIGQGVVAMVIGTSLLLSFSLTVIAKEGEKNVVATGVTALKGENIAGARQAAVQDALRQAVE
ncbi:hypothetical protein N9174_05040, partial [bacterium]|nr:hypothetical protein [bacterium]